jgi:hypothetical protein
MTSHRPPVSRSLFVALIAAAGLPIAIQAIAVFAKTYGIGFAPRGLTPLYLITPSHAQRRHPATRCRR